METQKDFRSIQGWGADLDHKNRPAYPKERVPARDIGVHWLSPDYQDRKVEILKSNERPEMTPVFGTTVPPSGFSGVLRRWAFKFSENDVRHWLILITADRINMIEGLFDDLLRGKIPNVFKEMGGKAEFKYNKKGFIKKAAFMAVVLGGVSYLLLRKRNR